MQHPPATHAFSSVLLHILQKTEVLLQRRIECGERAEYEHMLDGLEVQDSDWAAWIKAEEAIAAAGQGHASGTPAAVRRL